MQLTRHIHVVLVGQISLMHCSWLLLETMTCVPTESPQSLPMLQLRLLLLELLVAGNHEGLVLVVVFLEVYGVMDHTMIFKIHCKQQ